MANPIAGVIIGKTLQDTDFSNLITPLTDGNSFFPGPTDYKVTQSGTPGMSVVVSTGWGYHYIGSKSAYFQSYLGTQTTLSVPSNASGSTRIDIVCVKFDTSVASNSAGDNIFTLQYVSGTPSAGVPATPANYTKLAEVSVANNATSITNGNITDRRLNLSLQAGTIQFVGEVNGTPANPPSGTYKLYFKTDGKAYSLDSTGLETAIGASAIKARAYLSGAQSVVASTDVKILFDAETTDPGNNFDSATNHRFTVPSGGDGDYEVKLLATFASPDAATSAHRYGAEIFKNGAVVSGPAFANSNGGNSVSAFVSDTITLAAGDYIEGFVFHDSSGSKALVTGSGNTYITIRKIS